MVLLARARHVRLLTARTMLSMAPSIFLCSPTSLTKPHLTVKDVQFSMKGAVTLQRTLAVFATSTCLPLPLQVIDKNKADLLRAKLLGSNAQKQVASPDFLLPASHTDPPKPASTAGAAAASQLPRDASSPPALPDQTLPEASLKDTVPEQVVPQAAVQHSESLATAVSNTPALTHGKRKRKADQERVRAAAGTENALAAGTEAAVESEAVGGNIASRSYAADKAPEPKQARQWKGSSKKALQGTLQAAFAKAKVFDYSLVAACMALMV